MALIEHLTEEDVRMLHDLASQPGACFHWTGCSERNDCEGCPLDALIDRLYAIEASAGEEEQP